jgi:hypothetical protein
MNINTISHPALAAPASSQPQATASVRNTPAAQPFATLMQQAHHAIGGRSVPSHVGVEARALEAKAAMNHTR